MKTVENVCSCFLWFKLNELSELGIIHDYR